MDVHENDGRCVPGLLYLNGMGLELTCLRRDATDYWIPGTISHNLDLLEKIHVLRYPCCYAHVLSLETKDIRTRQTPHSPMTLLSLQGSASHAAHGITCSANAPV